VEVPAATLATSGMPFLQHSIVDFTKPLHSETFSHLLAHTHKRLISSSHRWPMAQTACWKGETVPNSNLL
jgi:hypothetical protein